MKTEHFLIIRKANNGTKVFVLLVTSLIKHRCGLVACDVAVTCV